MSELSILNVYGKSSRADRQTGLLWYQEAHDFCRVLSLKYSLPLESVVGVVAALSPRNRWEKNKLDALRLIDSFHSGEDLDTVSTSTFNSNKNKAITILTKNENPFSVLSGNKVRAFYSNILELKSSRLVTIDTHAYSVYVGTRTKAKAISDKEYTLASLAYVRASNSLGLHPIQLQAVCWLTYKRLMGI